MGKEQNTEKKKGVNGWKTGIKFLSWIVTICFVVFILSFSGMTASVQAATIFSCPTGTKLYKVVDIYHGDTTINGAPYDGTNYKFNWPALVQNGVSAVYMKATEGTTVQDNTVAQNVAGAQSQGLKYGFYTYFYPHVNQDEVKNEVTNFYNVIHKYAYSCIPALDVESIKDTSTGNNVSKTVLLQSIHTFLNTFEQLTGQSMMIYADVDFINNYLKNDSSLAAQKLWVARYFGDYINMGTPSTTNINSVSPSCDTSLWKNWDMWQYTQTMTIKNEPTLLDADLATSSIFINIPDIQGHIDSVTFSKGSYNSTLAVIGWGVARTGVSRVDFYYRSAKESSGTRHWAGTADSYYGRSDVQSIVNPIGYYLNPDRCGFNFSYDTRALSTSSYTLYTAVIANDGSVKWISTDFNVIDQPAPQLCIDSPKGTVGGDFAVSGWALNYTGTSRLDAYVDSNTKSQKFYSTAFAGNSSTLSRPDVNARMDPTNLYSNHADSGYRISISAKDIQSGTHSIRVASIPKIGSAIWKTLNFTVPGARGSFDSPYNGQIFSNADTIRVGGWTLDHAGISRIDVYVDLNQKNQQFYSSASDSSANLRTSRGDVHTKVDFSSIYENSLNSGFSFTFPAQKLTSGRHTVHIAVISNDGSAIWMSRTIQIR